MISARALLIFLPLEYFHVQVYCTSFTYNSRRSSTRGFKKWLISRIEGSLGPGMIPAKNMFSVLKRSFGGRFRHTMYNPITVADQPACLSWNGLKPSILKLNR